MLLLASFVVLVVVVVVLVVISRDRGIVGYSLTVCMLCELCLAVCGMSMIPLLLVALLMLLLMMLMLMMLMMSLLCVGISRFLRPRPCLQPTLRLYLMRLPPR